MHNFGLLLKGELMRMVKYKILQISFVVTLLWLLIIFLIGKEQAGTFVPLFIFMDAALMTILMVGASLFYEKQENTLKTLLITPSGFSAVIISKVIAGVYLAMQSTVIISLFSVFVYGVSIQLFWLYIFVVLITIAHTALGFTFAIYSRDFNGLIAAVGLYMILFAFPSIFYALGLFTDVFEVLLMFSPTHASLLLIDFSFYKDVATWKIIFGVLYLSVIIGVLFIAIVAPKYSQTAVRE